VVDLVPGSLSHALRTRAEAVLASWAHRFERSPMRMPRPIDPRTHGALVAGLIEALGEASLSPTAELRPGASAVRELEKQTTFAGSGLAAGGASGYDVAALILSLRDAVLEFAGADEHQPVLDIFEWLVVVALDAFATAGAISARERADAQIEEGTPVILVTPDVPALLLLGAPSGATFDGLFARTLLLVVRTGAKSLIVDVGGITDPMSPTITEAADRFFAQTRLQPVEILLSGAPDAAATLWQSMAQKRGVTLRSVDRFDAAVSAALQRAGTALVRRG
jgi:hypothetical protein